jgi:cell pole-organizing protein PopZ
MSADNDPSMDDILASIRKIISDDEARAQVSGNAVPATPPANTPFESRSTAANREDVLLLTDLIEEPRLGASSPEPEAPTPLPVPRVDPVSASEMPQPNFNTPNFNTPPTSPSGFEPSLVASSVAGATASAFDRLSQAVEDRKAAPAAVEAAPAPSLPLGNGGKTIEDLVKEMLRPMLKDWIDRSLPPMVERLVEREIARLTRR